MDAPQAVKKCPMCAEDIQAEAVKCKHCGSMLDGSAASPAVTAKPAPLDAGRRLMNWGGAVLLGGVGGGITGSVLVHAFARWPGPRGDDTILAVFFGGLLGAGVGFVYGGTKFGPSSAK